eukprot:8375148-Pyramimonas_sp.AAC.1
MRAVSQGWRAPPKAPRRARGGGPEQSDPRLRTGIGELAPLLGKLLTQRQGGATIRRGLKPAKLGKDLRHKPPPRGEGRETRVGHG